MLIKKSKRIFAVFIILLIFLRLSAYALELYDITGDVIFNVDSETGEVTVSVEDCNYDFSALKLTWSGGATGTEATVTPKIGALTSCTLKMGGAYNSLFAYVTVYKIEIKTFGAAGTDAVFIDAPYGKDGDEIIINYNLGEDNNLLIYSGVKDLPDRVWSENQVSGISSYIISSENDPAIDGVITLTANFSHTEIFPYANIEPAEAIYKKGSMGEDLFIKLDLNGNILSHIETDGGLPLIFGKDYIIDENYIIFYNSWLESLKSGSHQIKFEVSSGIIPVLNLEIDSSGINLPNAPQTSDFILGWIVLTGSAAFGLIKKHQFRRPHF